MWYKHYMLDARTKQIWRGLVDYANARDLRTDIGLVSRLAEIVSELIPAMAKEMSFLAATSPGMHLWNLKEIMERAASEWNFVSKVQKARSDLGGDDGRWFLEEAQAHQSEIDRVLRWFCSPKPAIRSEIEEYVWLHGAYHVSFNKLTPKTSQRCGLRELHPDPAYEHVPDPICQFLLMEHQRYHLGDYDHFKGRLVPIQFCKEEACSNLVVAFKKRKLCGTSECDERRLRRETDIQQAVNRDTVFVSRLRNGKLGKLDLVLVQDGVIKKLREIEKFWPQNKLGKRLHSHASRLVERAKRIKEAAR